MRKHITTINCDKDDCYFELPDEILKELDWHEGDTLIFNRDENGVISLTRKYSSNPSQLDLFGESDE